MDVVIGFLVREAEAIVKYKFNNILERGSHIVLYTVFTTKHETHVSQVIYFASGVPPLFPEKALFM
jgi:hypothetical protein